MAERSPQNKDWILRIRNSTTNLDRHAIDPVVSHLFGLIMTTPSTIEQIVTAMSSIANRDVVLNHIQYFQALGIIDLVEPEGPRIPPRSTISPEDASLPIFRDYSGYILSDEEISAPGNLPLAIKQELVFLSKYGANLNFYKILGLSPSASDQEIRETHQRLKDFWDPRHFTGKDLGQFSEKINLARAIIERTGVLCDPEKRKKYDRLLLAGEKEKSKISIENDKKDSSQKRKAEEHYAKATFLAAQESPETIREALTLIKEAILLDPQNQEYKWLLQKLEKINRKYKIDAMLASLEQGDFELFDGEKMKKEIGKVLDLAGHTAEIHLKLARILMDKGLLVVARKLAYQSKRIDPAYAAEADHLVQKIDQVLDYYKRSGKVVREQ